MNLNHFKEALGFIDKWEGGTSNHPNDKGRLTHRGVTQRTYDGWRAKKGLASRPVTEMTDDERILIYYEEYWAPAGCSELEYPFNIALFDTAVNCGVNRAVGWLRSADDPLEYLEVRKQHYITLATKDDSQRVFLKGWLNRLGDLRKLVEIGMEKAP